MVARISERSRKVGLIREFQSGRRVVVEGDFDLGKACLSMTINLFKFKLYKIWKIGFQKKNLENSSCRLAGCNSS